MTGHIERPARSRLVAENLSILELGTFMAASPLRRFIARGDGHPVLVFPGFAGTDRSTAPMRWILERRGHGVAGWRLGANTGAHSRILRGIERLLFQASDDTGEKVSLVGWSLGGVYARELARDHPDLVRQVVTLAAPFRYRQGDRGNASALYDIIGPRREMFAGRAVHEHERPPMPVPVSSIYSRSDGIVAWHSCLETSGPRRENIEVRSTHTGMGVNLLAVIALADRLALPADTWTPFQPSAILRAGFPRPAHWRPSAALGHDVVTR